MNELKNFATKDAKSKIILSSLFKLEKWLAENGWKAYDPFDGLSARGARFFTIDNHYLRIALQQTVRRFLINIRPLLGIRKHTSTKGMGFCALGYLKLYQATLDEEYLEKMRYCLDWLIKNYSEGYSGYAWGNNFSYESRGGTIPLDMPTIVWTSLIANVFLDAFEYLGESEYLNSAKSAADFILNDIGHYMHSDKELFFTYTPQDRDNPAADACVHNANLLGASLLARVYKHTGDQIFFELARRSVNYSLNLQLPTGGWYYGVHKKFWWEDSFHTGYNLEAIYGYIQATGDRSVEDKLIKSFNYYLSTFFKSDGTPRYYNYKTYPIDIQCASQGIQTLANLAVYNQRSIELAIKVAMWTIDHMQDDKGYFYFRKYPVATNKTPMFHWGQATMLSALSSLLKGWNT